MTQVTLKEATGLSTLAVHRWINNRVDSHVKTREKIHAALTIAYVKKYNPNAHEALPPFENIEKDKIMIKTMDSVGNSVIIEERSVGEIINELTLMVKHLMTKLPSLLTK